MKGCIDCKGKFDENQLYSTKEGTSCGPCFVRNGRELDEENFVKVRVDIGDRLIIKQRRRFNELLEDAEHLRLLKILKFKFKT